jgi:hypothetical protein
MNVLGQEASHLLLIRTNLGYGTVLTAACDRKGCSATYYYCYYYLVTFPYLQHAHLCRSLLFVRPNNFLKGTNYKLLIKQLFPAFLHILFLRSKYSRPYNSTYEIIV